MFPAWVVITVILLLPTVDAEYTYTKEGFERLDQHEELAWGDNWCVPTSAGICLAWFAENIPDYSRLIPDLKGDGIDVDDKYQAVDRLGGFMKTDPLSGTKINNTLKGLQDYITQRGCGDRLTITHFPNPTYDDFETELGVEEEDVLVFMSEIGRDDGRAYFKHCVVGRAYNETALGDWHKVSFVDPWRVAFIDTLMRSDGWIDLPLFELLHRNPPPVLTYTEVTDMISISPLNASAIIPNETLYGYAVVVNNVTYVINATFFYDVYTINGEVFGVVDGTVYNTTGTVYAFANRTVYIVDGTYFPVTGNVSIINGTRIYGLPSYTLTIYSSPTGVTFTVDGVPRTTPWSGTYSEGSSVSLVTPETHNVLVNFVWSHWSEDGDPNRIKTVTMDTDITLTAVYTRIRPVGGKATPINIPINKPESQIPWTWLTIIILAVSISVAYIKYRKKQ